MAELWPVTLPQSFLMSSYTEQLGDGRLKTSMDRGPAKMRRVSSIPPAALSGQMRMNGDQVRTLETFFKTTTLGGTLVFTFPSQRAGAVLQCRFADNPPSWTRAGINRYLVTLQLEAVSP